MGKFDDYGFNFAILGFNDARVGKEINSPANVLAKFSVGHLNQEEQASWVSEMNKFYEKGYNYYFIEETMANQGIN